MSERRYFSQGELRVQGNSRIISGYAARFNSWSNDLGGFKEKIHKGCFTRSINNKGNDIKCLLNHEPSTIVARTTNGSLTLKEDDKGLFFRADCVKTTAGNDLLELVRTQTISQCSFGFRVIKDSWTQTDSGKLDSRVLLECQIYDVSPVVFPAYSETSVDVGLRMISEATGLEVSQISRSIAGLERYKKSDLRFPEIQQKLETIKKYFVIKKILK